MASPLLEAAGIQPWSKQLESQMSMGPPSTRRDLGQMQQQWRGVQQAQANERYDAAGAQMAQEARDAALMRQNRAATRPIYSADTPLATPGQQALASHDATNPAPPPVPGATPASANTPTNQAQGGGLMGEYYRQKAMADEAARSSAASPVSSPASASQPTATNNVIREGNSYTGSNVAGDITINGQVPGGAGSSPAPSPTPSRSVLASAGISGYGSAPPITMPASATAGPSLMDTAFGSKREGAGESLSSGSQAESIGRLIASGQLRPPEPGFSGVIGQQSGNGNMWSRTPEQQRRDAEVQASSIHKPTAAIGANGIRSMDARDIEGIRGTNALQREIIQQRGAAYRTGVQQAGESARAGERTGIDRQRLGLEQTAAGFSNRASAQMENLRGVLSNPNATATERQQAQQTILALQGKQPQNEWGVQVTPTTKNVDGSTSMGSIVRYNKATGQAEIVQQPGQGAPAPLPAKEQLSQGQIYQTARGPARWNGSSFDPT